MQTKKRFTLKPTLAWEIVFALLLKSALLFLLWWGFFSHAPDKHAVSDLVAQRIFATGQDFSFISRRNDHD